MPQSSLQGFISFAHKSRLFSLCINALQNPSFVVIQKMGLASVFTAFSFPPMIAFFTRELKIIVNGRRC
ncbi:hypothetical protein K435DRAFT_880164 [Dendrothele bispora CBS 962.96]|uniref:Uncharacterized protein n=1 Tax=Dendrothele bispora (strain CBS 962.96) TaxID=1314807 RepID=A0A4S8KJV6_DENBC|nr:hypothetical protein K435DRAFT_880164 [Dendrothele bispora CBS 962.96]